MLIYGRNLFPLSTVAPALTGYFLDADLRVWSTRKKPGSISELKGSRYAGDHYFTLSGLTFKKSEINSWAQRFDTAFKQHTGKDAEVAPRVELGRRRDTVDATQRNHAGSIEEGIKGRGWIIATFEDNKLHFGSNPAIHLSQPSLRAEMARLASLRPGVKFVSMRIDGAVVCGGLNWE